MMYAPNDSSDDDYRFSVSAALSKVPCSCSSSSRASLDSFSAAVGNDKEIGGVKPYVRSDSMV